MGKNRGENIFLPVKTGGHAEHSAASRPQSLRFIDWIVLRRQDALLRSA